MNKTIKIGKREFSSRVRSKSFIIMTLLGPLLLAGILIVPLLLEKYEQQREKRVAIVDESNLLGHTLQDFESYKFTVVINASVDDLSKGFENSGFDAVLFIPNNIYSSNSVVLYSNVWVDDALKAYVGYALRRDLEYMALMHENVAPETIGKVSTPVFVGVQKWNEKGETVDNESSMEKKQMVALTFVSVIYIFILMYGILVLRGVVEEKMNRVVEIIISSVKPVQFMVGKIVGIGLVGLLQFALWVLLTLGLIAGAQYILFPEPYVPSQLPELAETLGSQTVAQKTVAPNTVSIDYAVNVFQTLDGVNWMVMLVAFLFFFVFGYLLYAAIFASIGALCDQDTETQQFVIPVTLPLVIPFVLLPMIISNPNGYVALWLSQIPFTSPLAMIARLPFGVPFWQVGLSVVILLLTCAFAVWCSSALYRSGLLMYGKKFSIKSMFKKSNK
ncbi:MAG: ABC transporter permease [Bacteroidales bacterium]|nr:ABC transporter permease [Bacteroidales bacterium]